MRRYWVEPEKISDSQVVIDGELFHHLTDVCRLKPGDKFEVLAGDHRAYLVTMKERDKRRAIGEIIESRSISPIPKPFIKIALSIPRFQKLDLIIEKSVELGVKSIHPFVSDFSFVRKIDSALIDRGERWKRIVKAATQQSGRGDFMEVDKPTEFMDILDRINQRSDARGLFSYEGEGVLDLKSALGEFPRELEEVWLLIGSEGGFSADEVKRCEKQGLKAVTMGEQVLRVETACLALVSVLKYEFGLMK